MNNHKKSNEPESSRKFRQHNRPIPGRVLKMGPAYEFNRILDRAYALYKESGRREKAVIYLSSNRPWLSEFLGELGTPSSGELLDRVIKQREGIKQ
jgi:hypothetical protein